jgi:putative ABC transport system permease protein
VTTLRFILALAWRDTRAGWRRLLLLTTAVLCGVAALVAINSFTANIRVSVGEQAQALLGADLALQSRASVDTSSAATALLDSLQSVGGDAVRTARSASLIAMAFLERSGTARLVQVRTVDPGWPFHGTIRTAPDGIWPGLQDGGIIVDPSLLTALDATVGDTLVLGNARFPVLGTAVSIPGEIGLQAAFGATVFIAHDRLAGTGLVAFGSRVEHTRYLSLPESIDPQRVAASWRELLRNQRVGLRTVADDRDQLTQDLTRLGRFLGLVALASLLLGGLGSASAITVLVRQRLDGIAMLRCLGATSGQVIGAYLLQATVMGLIGSLAGAALGIGVQQVMPYVLADLLPVDVRVTPSPSSVLIGVGLGTWTAAAFALLPLLAIRDVTPLATLRRTVASLRSRWDLLRALAAFILAASVTGLAMVQVGSTRNGAWFAAAAGAALVLLWLASHAVIRLARRLTPVRAPYLVRQGLANLHRPGNQTTTVVLALGFGAFLLLTLFVVQANLLGGLRMDEATSRANLVLIDVQGDQHDVVRDALRREAVEPGPMVPIVPMRLEAVNGLTVREMIARGGVPARDTADTGGDEEMSALWAWRREYRSTWRAETGSGERVVAGEWFGPEENGSGTAEDPAAISVEQDVARELGIGLGDTVTWNVQGALVHSVVRSLREVEWARFEPNFFVVFAPGPLDGAPQTWVTLARVTDPAARGRIQRTLAERAPNVTSVDLGELQRAIEAVITKVVLAIRFLATFSLATGAIVLIGAVLTSRWQRLREGTLLRTLGATRRQVLVILGVEYLALGSAALVVAVTLAVAAGWALARWSFATTFRWPVVPTLELAGGILLLTLLVGLLGSRDVLGRAPMEVLRNES